MITVFGGAGSGKTSMAVVLKYLFPDAAFRFLAPKDSQVTKLLATFGQSKDSNDGLTVSEFKEKAFPKINDSENLEWVPRKQNSDKSEKGDYINIKEDTSTDWSWFGDESLRFIIADEIAMNDEIILKMLSKYAESNHAIIVGLGDTKQNTPRISYKNGTKVVSQPSGFEDVFSIKTPYLIANFRAAYRAKADNYASLLNLVSEVQDFVETSPTGVSATKADEKYSELNKEHVTKLKYARLQVGIAGDYITSDETDFNKLLDKILDSDADILIVTDSTTNGKYISDKYQKPNVTIRTAEEAQGGEYDYVFVDKFINTDNGYKFAAAKDLYTISQRGSLGSIILDKEHKYENDLHIVSDLDYSSAVAWDMTGQQKTDFRNWRMSALESLVPTDKFSENITVDMGVIIPDGGTDDKNPEKQNGNEEKEQHKVEEIPQEQPTEPEVPKETSDSNQPTEQGIEEKTPEKETELKIDPAIPVKRTIVEAPTAGIEKITLESPEEEKEVSEEVHTETVNYDQYNTPEYFDGTTMLNHIFTPEFWESEKADGLSAYNYFKQLGINLTDKEYREFCLWAARKALLNEFDFTDTSDLILKNNAIKKALKNVTVPFAEVRTIGNISEIRIVIQKQGETMAHIPIARSNHILQEGLLNLDGKKPFEIITKADYNHENGEQITIRELKKKYPWLRFAPFAGTVSPTDSFLSSKSSDAVNAIEWAKHQTGKTFMMAYGLKVPIDVKSVYKTGRSNGEVYLGQSREQTSRFGIQRIVESVDDIILFGAAVNYLTSFDESCRDFLIKKWGLKPDKTLTSQIVKKLAEITGDSNWNAGILTEKIKSGDKKWRYYFEAIDTAVKSSALISDIQSKRIFADIFGAMLHNPNDFKNEWFRLHTKFHNLNDRSFGLIVELDPKHRYLIYSDGKLNNVGQIHISAIGSSETDWNRILTNDFNFSFETSGHPQTFAYELIAGISEFMKTFDGNLTLDDFNSSRVRVSGAQITFDQSGKIQNVFGNTTIASWFNIFDPSSVVKLTQFLNSEQYKHKLYGNIPGSKENLPGSQYKETVIDDNYVTMASEWHGEIVKIKGQIFQGSSENIQEGLAIQSDALRIINDVKVLGQKFVPNDIINSIIDKYTNIINNTPTLDDEQVLTIIQSAITEINNYILENATSKTVSLLKIAENGTRIELISSSDSKPFAYANLIKLANGTIDGDQIQIVDSFKTKQIEVVSGNVMTSEGDLKPGHFIMFEQDGILKCLPTQTYSSWKELYTLYNEWASRFNSDTTPKEIQKDLGLISTYIDGLLKNTADAEMASKYWSVYEKYIQRPTEFEFVDRIQSKLEEYLISRLNNDEC